MSEVATEKWQVEELGQKDSKDETRQAKRGGVPLKWLAGSTRTSIERKPNGLDQGSSPKKVGDIVPRVPAPLHPCIWVIWVPLPVRCGLNSWRSRWSCAVWRGGDSRHRAWCGRRAAAAAQRRHWPGRPAFHRAPRTVGGPRATRRRPRPGLTQSRSGRSPDELAAQAHRPSPSSSSYLRIHHTRTEHTIQKSNSVK